MDLNAWIIAIAAIIIILIIIKLIFKTIKIIFFVGIILVALVFVYNYNSSKPVDDNILTFDIEKDYEQLSLYDCEFENECMYVVNASDCNLVPEECNNMIKSENYIINGKRCNKEAIIIDLNITCDCIIEDDLSYCNKL